MKFRNNKHIGDRLGVPRTMDEMDEAVSVGYIIPKFRDGIITVDKLLDHVDVVLEWYIPSAEAIDFMNFMRLVLGEEPENANPKAHYFLIDCIFKSPEVKPFFDVRNIDYELLNDRVLVLATREFSKSTLLGSMLVLYIAATGSMPGFGKINYMLYVSDSMRNNVKTTMETIGSVYRESQYLRNIFEDARTVQDEINFVRKPVTKKELALYDEFVHKRGLKPSEVPGRMKRTFSMTGIGASALPLDSILYTKNGLTTIGSCVVGDEIFGADGKLAKITYKSKIFTKPMYRITLADKRTIDVCEDHVNSILVKSNLDRREGIVEENINIATRDLVKMKLFHERDRGFYKNGTKKISKQALLWINNSKALEYTNKNLPIDPYTLGLLLGDGSFKNNHMNILHCEKCDFDDIKQYIPYEIGYIYFDKRNNVISANIKTLNSGVTKLNLRGKTWFYKDIPNEYMIGSINQRLEILRGLMDSDGTILKTGRTIFNTSSPYLSKSVLNLVRSLGGGATKISRYNTSKLGVKTLSYKIEFSLNVSVFKLQRKKDREKLNRKRSIKSSIQSIEEIPIVESQCIAIDNEERQFITNDYVRTHNTGGRGSREALSRPNGVFFDDLLGSEADANSETILDNIESTIESDMLPALSGNGSFALFAGTPYNKRDPAYKRIEDGSWLPVVFPKAEKMDKTVTAENFRGVWEDRHTFKKCKNDFLKAQRADDNGNPVPMRKLRQEYYLRISSDKERLVPDSLIQWFDRELISSNSWAYNWVITTDYTSTGNQGSNLSCNMLWAVGWNGDFFLMDLTLRKLELEEQYNETFAMAGQTVGQTRGVEVGIELDGQQNIHLIPLKDRMPKKSIYFSFARQKGAEIGSVGIRSRLEGGSKHWRFRAMLPYWQNRKVWFAEELRGSEDMNELLEEIKYCTYSGFGSKYDDGIDGLSQLNMMHIPLPPKDVENEPRKRVGMKKGGINAIIWGKKNSEGEDGTAYDSYNG